MKLQWWIEKIQNLNLELVELTLGALICQLNIIMFAICSVKILSLTKLH